MPLPDLWNKSNLVMPHLSKTTPISKCACNCVFESLVQASFLRNFKRAFLKKNKV